VGGTIVPGRPLGVRPGRVPVLAEPGGRSVPTETFLDRLPERSQVWAIDADGLVVRPGPRVVDGIKAFAAIFRPDGDTAHSSTRRIR
jgi:hypothetical protein